MKISASKLVKRILDDTKTFSFSDSKFNYVYSYYSSGLSHIERFKEETRIFSEMRPVFIHILMYCYPDKYIGSERTVKNNEKEIVSSWLRKLSKQMLDSKGRFYPSNLVIPMNKVKAKSITNELKSRHGYTEPRPDDQAFENIQLIFLNHWSELILQKLNKRIYSLTDQELIKMLRETKKDILSSSELKDFKLQK
jgi:hypothetical protein